MKAISPMIATVLLIAFTVAIGGVLSLWLSTLTSTQTGTVGTQGTNLAKCAGSSVVVTDVVWPSGTGNGRVNVTVAVNSGTEVLNDLNVTVIGQGTSAIGRTTGTFSPGQSVAISVVGAPYPPEIVSATMFCQSTVPRTGECKAGEKCMKS